MTPGEIIEVNGVKMQESIAKPVAFSSHTLGSWQLRERYKQGDYLAPPFTDQEAYRWSPVDGFTLEGNNFQPFDFEHCEFHGDFERDNLPQEAVSAKT